MHNPFTYFGQTYDESTGLYYLRARYYDPTTGRFTQQDPAEDGYNWYVYGNNNPVMYVDEYGELAYPGQIHNIVVNYIANKYSYNREQTISYKVGWGRADLISNSGEVWDVKRDKPKQISAGVKQVQKYVNNTWKNRPNTKLSVGGYISPDSLIKTINVDTYYIKYRYAKGGVIAYDYYKITDWEAVKSYASKAGVTLVTALIFLVSEGSVDLMPVY